MASEGNNSRGEGGGGGGGGAKGDAPGRVREGGTPPAQLGGMGERCELPHRVWGSAPEANAFAFKKLQKLHKNAAAMQEARPRPLFYMYTKPPTHKKKWLMFKRAYRRNALPVSTFLERNGALTRF